MCHVTIDLATLNIPISEGGTSSSRIACTITPKQSYRGLKLLLSDTEFMTMVYFMFIYHRFQEY